MADRSGTKHASSQAAHFPGRISRWLQTLPPRSRLTRSIRNGRQAAEKLDGSGTERCRQLAPEAVTDGHSPDTDADVIRQVKSVLVEETPWALRRFPVRAAK